MAAVGPAVLKSLVVSGRDEMVGKEQVSVPDTRVDPEKSLLQSHFTRSKKECKGFALRIGCVRSIRYAMSPLGRATCLKKLGEERDTSGKPTFKIGCNKAGHQSNEGNHHQK